jgi:hypothetical protein
LASDLELLAEAIINRHNPRRLRRVPWRIWSAAAAEGLLMDADLESSIPHDDVVMLQAPLGVLLRNIRVRTMVEPNSAGLTIYGYTSPKTIESVDVPGGITVIDLPFVWPRIFIEKSFLLDSYSIDTLGHDLF